MGSPLEKPEGLNWNAASVELPEVPTVQPGADAMSMTIAGVLPTMAASLTANVATLQAKENMFSGKLVAAESAYQNADDQGGQSVGQLTSMMGQLSQMGQQAGQAGGQASGLTGQFGQLMQPMMKAFESMKGEGGGSPAGGQQGQPQGAGTPGAGAPQGAGAGQPSGGQNPSGGAGTPQQARDDAGEARQDEARREAREENDREREEREARERDERVQAAPPATAGPADTRPGPGPVPVAPDHPRQTGGEDDLARRM